MARPIMSKTLAIRCITGRTFEPRRPHFGITGTLFDRYRGNGRSVMSRNWRRRPFPRAVLCAADECADGRTTDDPIDLLLEYHRR